MNEQALRQELDKVGSRYHRLRLWTTLTIVWLVLALAGAALLVLEHQAHRAVPWLALFTFIAAPAVLVPLLLAALRRTLSPAWIAHRIEKRFPDLDARLLAALEQGPDAKTSQLGFLQETVVREAVIHARTHRWESLVSSSWLRLAQLGQWATLAAFAIVFFIMAIDVSRHPVGRIPGLPGSAYRIKVEPGDTSVERGASLLVLARFNGRLPGEVQLLSRDGDGKTATVAMSKSLNDPVFATRMQSVNRELSYSVRFGDEQTEWFKASVFEYPDLKQADANLKFPAYTGLEEKLVQDVRSVTAVEGTKATFSFHLNKPVTDATLLPRAPSTRPADGQAPPSESPLKLAADPKDPTLYSVSMDLKQSQTFRLQLRDAEGRRNKDAPELVVNVNPNRPADVKLTWPGRDVDVSALQEMQVAGRVSDDFGVRRAGLTYSLAGQAQTEVVLAENLPSKEQRDIANLLSLERLAAEPDQLLSYYFWAEDIGPDSNVRRTSGDMFFAEVRPFEEIFRQGQPPSQSEQEQQQQQNQNQQGQQNGQQAEQLAELQKQVIAATWKVMRRETAAAPTNQFVPDVDLITSSQANVREQATALGEKLTDARSRAYLTNVMKFIDQGLGELKKASTGMAIAPLSSALPAEQSAYQELLKLRAREFDVFRGNRQQRQQQRGSSSSASSRRQQQLNELQLQNDQNRYEAERNAPSQQDNPQQRETRQVLNRLKELAQRQEDLNRQMREMQSALEQAKDPVQREEIQRQLARLRDQQRQQLRDTDELRDRMNQPENQQRMADSQQQLEQTRENVRRASESLEKGQVPEAATAGARASEQLNNLRDDFRKAAAGQFNEAMNNMRQEARDLDQKQQNVSQKLSQMDTEQRRSLRQAGEREQVAQDLDQQKQQLNKVLDQMRKTIDEAESTEPLLSKQLYDTVRETSQKQTDQALDVSKQLVEKGFTKEARQAESEAGKGITQLRKGVEQAARSVLGDEAEALRRARNQLDQLTDDLEQEVQHRTGAASGATAGATTRPRPEGANRIARSGSPSTHPTGVARGQRPSTQRSGEQIARADTQQPGDSQRDSQNAGAQQDQQNLPGQQNNAGQNRQSRAQQQRGQQSGEQQARGNQPQPGQGEDQQSQDGQQDETQGQDAQAQGQPSEQRQGKEGQRQPGQGQQARGQQGQGRERQGQQNPDQQGQGQQARGQGQQDPQGRGQQARGQQPGQQPGQGQARGQGQGQSPDGQQPDQQYQNESPQNDPSQQTQQANARGNQRGNRTGGGGLRGQRDGENPQDANPPPDEAQQQAADTNQPGDQPVNPNADPRDPSAPRDSVATRLRQRRSDEIGGDNNNRTTAGGGMGNERYPLTGNNFRDWSDRLRDVEEMVNDPRLRAQAAGIRDRAREMRAEFTRHSKEPNWDLVEQQLTQPLVELRNAVADEVRRRDSSEALVPIDREPVPPQYAEQVRKYYERLGSGR